MKLTQDMLYFISLALFDEGKAITPDVVKELEAQPESVLSRALYYASQPPIIEVESEDE